MRPPFASVEFATLGSTPDPVQIRVIRRSFSHEIVILRFKDRDLSAKIYQSDEPVRLTWGIWPKFREEFASLLRRRRSRIQVDQATLQLGMLQGGDSP